MAETPQLPNSSAAPLPAARIEDEHIPAVSSPLNPDAAASRTRTREQREKKAVVSPKVDASPNLTDIVMQTLKKRELADGETQGPSKKAKKPVKDPSVLSPIRYRLPSPKPTDYDPPKAPTLILASEKAGMPFYETTEHVFNRKSFRYTNAIVDPAFPSSQYHRSSETEPFGPRIDFKDAGSHVVFDNQMMAVSTEKGFRMARANVGAREGRYYWECRILSGIKADPLDSEANGHVRVGWSRREGSLEGPVGYDPYSYGIRDVAGEKVHMSRPKAFANADFCEGDVMGLEIMLPSLALHRKVVDGVYNKAVDVADDLDLASSNDYMDIIRDRYMTLPF
jgi:COMPASS component BRE2